MAFKDIRRMVGYWYKMNVQEHVKAAQSYSYFKEISIGICGGALIVGAVWGYRYYANKKESDAQIAFGQASQLFLEAQKGKGTTWQQVQIESSNELSRYKNSSVAPYLKMLQANALVQQGKLTDACIIFDEIIKGMPKDSFLVPLLQTKRALVKLDETDPKVISEGLQELVALADNADNKYSDVAQYYCGLYYWSAMMSTKL